jgi:metal-sulfur cluster biosynthetic enzyme
MGKPVPVEINHIKAKGVVRVSWDDAHVGSYPEDYLRGYCPCALCQGHDAAERKFISVPDAKLGQIRAVGNYAVEFQWEDGHSTGIYTFEYLRSLCPCAGCKGDSTESQQNEGVRAMPTKEEVYDVLHACYDPEIPVDIVNLGLVYDVEVDDGKVDVKMTLTTPGCGMGTMIASDAQQKILTIPGVTEANVDLVWDPPWDPSRISEEARQKLGIG